MYKRQGIAVTFDIKQYFLTKDSIDWVIPHQANLRIIDAVAHRLEVPREKVLINIAVSYTHLGYQTGLDTLVVHTVNDEY